MQTREMFRLRSELKWGKVSRAKNGAYTEFINQVSSRLVARGPAYYCIVIDTSLVRHNEYNQGSRDTGFSKFLYQLLKKLARLFERNAHFYVYLDKRNTRHPPDEVRIILNQGCRKEYGHTPFRIIEFRDSKKSDLIQWVDIVTGAIAYHWNDRDSESNASPARIELASKIAVAVGLRSLRQQTGSGLMPFSIWRMRLRK